VVCDGKTNKPKGEPSMKIYKLGEGNIPVSEIKLGDFIEDNTFYRNEVHEVINISQWIKADNGQFIRGFLHFKTDQKDGLVIGIHADETCSLEVK
jgi:hypothetical protein